MKHYEGWTVGGALMMAATALAIVTLAACTMNPLPRNMKLKAFDPHRPDFTCTYEADVVAPITEEAEALFRRGMAITSYELSAKDRNHVEAARLWKQAADLGHWKAAMNLAGLYERGLGVEEDTEKTVLIVEDLMRKGVPAAFDKMGTLYDRGIGVKVDADRAYAFWQLAADMGSPTAQAYIGEKIDGAYDNPAQGFWGNEKVARKMLECSFAQGSPDGVSLLAWNINHDGNHERALQVFHEGVKLGSEECAVWLSASFGLGDELVGGSIDSSRSDRYSDLGEALRHNPDLRFPHLDKVVPLPPADLPQWDGELETLVDAAKGVVPAKPAPITPGAKRTGRAHIPQNVAAPAVNPRVAEGTARPTRIPLHVHRCRGHLPCPRTGIWHPIIEDGSHPLANMFHGQWDRTAYVHKGASFPDPRSRFLDIEPQALVWAWLDNANQEIGQSGVMQITLIDLNEGVQART